MRTGIGLLLICIGATCADSESWWIPAALLAAGSILVITNKKTPSRRQAKEGAKNKTFRLDYTMGRQEM